MDGWKRVRRGVEGRRTEDLCGCTCGTPDSPTAEALDRGVRGAGVGRSCSRPNAEAVGIEMRRLVARSAEEAT